MVLPAGHLILLIDAMSVVRGVIMRMTVVGDIADAAEEPVHDPETGAEAGIVVGPTPGTDPGLQDLDPAPDHRLE